MSDLNNFNFMKAGQLMGAILASDLAARLSSPGSGAHPC